MRENDIGTNFMFEILKQDDTPLDLTTATNVDLITILNGTRTVHQATVSNTPTDGIVTYTIQNGDIPSEGVMVVQAVVTFQDGSDFASSIVEVEIERRL